MPRISRIVVPDIPHHITQRGNRNQQVFFSDRDRSSYLGLLRMFAEIYSVKIWAYCLMDNHVHFISVPKTKEALIHCFQEVHRAYTRSINFREGWRGFLWQGRFSSFPMDEAHLIAAMRYVERNPVEAHMVERAQDYPWSSAKSHVCGSVDALLSDCYLSEQIPDWDSFLRNQDNKEHKAIETAIRSGRPLGSDQFVESLAKKLDRDLLKKKRGPKVKANIQSQQNSMNLVLPLK